MQFSVSRHIAAPAADVWELLIDVGRWHDWGPSVTGAELDSPGFRAGSTGRVRTVPGIRLPFTVTEVRAGRSWSWSVAGVRATGHLVVPEGDGCRVIHRSLVGARLPPCLLGGTAPHRQDHGASCQSAVKNGARRMQSDRLAPMTEASPATDAGRTILVLNGPNLNLLGTREPEKYGTATLADVEQLAKDAGAAHGVEVECFQSNHEGALVDAIHAARGKAIGIVLNAGAYTHTSVAIRDAISAVQIPAVEVHITNVHAREEFRHHSYLSDISKAVIAGAGVMGYRFAVEYLAELNAGKA